MRILLIDDHILFRDGLKYLLADLDSAPEFLEAGNCREGLDLAAGADIVLLDLKLPDMHGLEALVAMREAAAAASVVVLSSEDDPGTIRAAIDAGAAGFIPKSSTQDVLIAALRLVLAGGSYLPPHLLDGTPAAATTAGPAPSEALANLSDRQREVLMCAVQGKANKVIARDLDISEATVKAHLSASFRALGVSNRTEAVFAVANAAPARGSA